MNNENMAKNLFSDDDFSLKKAFEVEIIVLQGAEKESMGPV
jgi:hypothetical protein